MCLLSTRPRWMAGCPAATCQEASNDASGDALKCRRGSRQRVDDRCRTVAAHAYTRAAADVSEGGTVPSSPADSAVSPHARTGAIARCRRVAGRARTVQPGRRPPRALPDQARRRPGRRRPRRQPGHRAPGGRRAARRAAGEHAARRDPAGRRASAGGGGRRRVRTALRHGLHRGGLPGRAVRGARRAAARRDVPSRRRRARPAGSMPAGRQDDPRHAGAGGGGVRRGDRGGRDGPGRVRGGAPGRARGHALDARPRRPARPRPATWASDRSATATRAPCRACSCCRALGGR